MTDRYRYLCRSCGERSVSWAAAQRHADSERHYRIELVLDPTPTTMRKP